MKKIFSILIIAILVTGSVLGFQNAYAKKHEDSKINYTGEEIFKGILFAQGPLAKELDTLYNKEVLQLANTQETKKAVNYLTKEIRKKNPKYFDSLKKAVEQKDPSEIDRILLKANKYINEIKFDSVPAKKGKNLNNEVAPAFCGPTVCGAYLYVVVVHAAAVVATAAGIFGVYLVNTTYGPKGKSKMSEKEKQFEKELIIKTLLDSVHN